MGAVTAVQGAANCNQHLNNSFRIKFLGNIQFSTHATGDPYIVLCSMSHDNDNDPFLHPLKYPLKYTLMVM